MSRVLIVEDMNMIADSMAEALRQDGHAVTVVLDPRLERAVIDEHFDVALVDMFFEPVPTVSGLETLDRLDHYSPTTKLVLWTTGESDRMLHLDMAFHKFRLSGALSKINSLEAFRADVRAIANSTPVFNSQLSVYDVGGKSAGDRLLGSELRRGIWRALVDDAASNEAIARQAGYSVDYVKSGLGDLYELVVKELELESDLSDHGRRKVFNVLGRVARRYRNFFLDETVLRLVNGDRVAPPLN